MRFEVHAIIAGLLLGGLLPANSTAASFQQTGNTLTMSNANVRLDYNLSAGTTDFYWKNSRKIKSFYSSFQLPGSYVKGTSYNNWSYTLSGSNQAIITAAASGLPTLKQYFTLDQSDSFLVRCEISGTNLSANYMGAVIVDATGTVDIGITNDNRALMVPFDNDGFVRYNAMPMNSSGTSYEVGAFYDNTSRNGLVVGSVTHDIWKTGIFFTGAANKLSVLNVFGGATNSADVAPHGSVRGNVVSSPTMFVGFGPDWRETMQQFAAANTNQVASPPWTNGVPLGWNSWGVLQENLTYADAIAVSDYFYVNLINQNFSDNGVAYINLDAFWDNLSPSELQTFASHCHAHGEKAGIYTGPFVWFGAATNATNSFVEGTSNVYRYSDALLRDLNGKFEIRDGGLAMDPTHPATLQRIDYYNNLYTNWGFDYVKVDFLSHGALEGMHYDTNVTTGIAAYNRGMQYFLNAVHGRMFISESIAPLFPYQYAHSRRIACDAQTSAISDTEYTMNSVSYGWWLNGLYPFNDPDIMVFGHGTDTNEAQSRLISGAVTGVFLNGDDLSNTNAQTVAHSFLTNAPINAVAKIGSTFMPVEGNTGSSAVNIFAREEGNLWSLAIFNYTSQTVTQTVSLARAGLPLGNWTITNLWDGSTTVVSNSITVILAPKQSKLFRAASYNSASLNWSGRTNAIWDAGQTTNWVNISNGLATVFNPSDQVLFNDARFLQTNVILVGALVAGDVMVNSSVNQFTFGGIGKISGTNNLIKMGTSTLALATTNDFKGVATVAGGILKAGNGALSSVGSIVITDVGTLDLFGNAIADTKTVVISGSGVGGNGAIINSGNDFYNQVFNIRLAGDTVLGGAHRWDLANGSSITGPHAITLVLSSGYAEWDTVALGNDVGNLEIKQGAFGIKGMGNTFGDPSATLTVDSEVDFWNSNFGANSGYAKKIHAMPGATLKVLTSPNTHLDANVTFEDGAQCIFLFGNSGQTMQGTCTLNGIVHLAVADTTATFSNVISGVGGFVWDGNNNNLVFSAANTFTGPSIIGSGLTLFLQGNGSIALSSLIFLGGNDSTAVRLDVIARQDNTLTLGNGQTLAGIGTISGNVTVKAGAVISPGGTNTTLGITTGSNTTGTIAAANNVALQGSTVIKLNGVGVCDSIRASGSISLGGSLNLVNINGTPLLAGQSFSILAATNIAGSFASINPVQPGANLLWDTSQLSAGKLKVIAMPPPPVVSSVVVSGGNVILAGSNGTAGAGYNLLSSTNLVDWNVIFTNLFDDAGNFRLTNPIAAGLSQSFYRLQLR